MIKKTKESPAESHRQFQKHHYLFRAHVAAVLCNDFTQTITNKKKKNLLWEKNPIIDLQKLTGA